MTQFIIKRDGERDLKFVGERIAFVESSDERAQRNYSGSTGRWAELALYRTKGGKLIAVQVGRTRWQGEHDRHSAWVCESEQDVIAALGSGWLAKELYRDAGIDASENIE